MGTKIDSDRQAALQAYAAGRLGTRDAIERAGLHDYADLVIVLMQNGLDLPEPVESPARSARFAKVSAILQPLLLHGSRCLQAGRN